MAEFMMIEDEEITRFHFHYREKTQWTHKQLVTICCGCLAKPQHYFTQYINVSHIMFPKLI